MLIIITKTIHTMTNQIFSTEIWASAHSWQQEAVIFKQHARILVCLSEKHTPIFSSLSVRGNEAFVDGATLPPSGVWQYCWGTQQLLTLFNSQHRNNHQPLWPFEGIHSCFYCLCGFLEHSSARAQPRGEIQFHLPWCFIPPAGHRHYWHADSPPCQGSRLSTRAINNSRLMLLYRSVNLICSAASHPGFLKLEQ